MSVTTETQEEQTIHIDWEKYAQFKSFANVNPKITEQIFLTNDQIHRQINVGTLNLYYYRIQDCIYKKQFKSMKRIFCVRLIRKCM